jgi:hypothetical protein
MRDGASAPPDHEGKHMKRSIVAGAVAGLLLLSTAASAAVTFDPEAGEGFVGKGDVQTALEWNNRELQQGADGLSFASVSEVVTEVSWICTNSNNENVQERARTTTTSVEGVVSAVARERNQITGFNLTGYLGAPTSSSRTDGNPLNSCPSGPWTLTSPAGEPEVVSSSSSLTVNGVELP